MVRPHEGTLLPPSEHPPPLLTWSEIRVEYPDLRDRLARDRHDHGALVQYLQLALGARALDRDSESEN